jgi:hypothetical protein
MLPAEVDIARIEVTRHRTGMRYQARVGVVAYGPKPSPRRDGLRVGVRVCWRGLPGGAIRVAVVKGAGPPPESLVAAGVLRASSDWAEAIYPASWRDLSQRTQMIATRRARGREELRRWLTDWISGHPADAEVLDPAGTLPAFAPRDLAAAATRLRGATPAGCEEPAEKLQAWLEWDRRLLQWEASEREQLAGRRNDAWRLRRPPPAGHPMRRTTRNRVRPGRTCA